MNSEKYQRNTLSLTIAPTLDCNMACPYCFEEKNKTCMSLETQEVLVNFVKKQSSLVKNLHVTWYGGEPLLEIGIIKDLSRKFISICEELKINYSSTVITNGVLLSPDTAKLLKEDCNVRGIQITIDGLPEFHNRRRILKDGRNSFSIIINNIQNVKELFNISVRINVDKKNYENIPLTADYFTSLGWGENPSFYIAPVESYETNCAYKSSDCLNQEEFTQLDVEIIKKIIIKNPKYIKLAVAGRSRGNYCGAVQLGFYVIDPIGDIYPCWNTIGQKKYKIGNIIDEGQLSHQFLKWITYEPNQKCYECNLLPICHGGCPYQYIVSGEHSCDKRAKGIIEVLKLAYEDYEDKKHRK